MSNKKIIFFLHFAGGNYYSLKELYILFPDCEAIPLELPGRGKRIREQFATSISEVVKDLVAEIIPLIESGRPYYFFGHSMGALLAYSLTQRLIELKLNLPKILFVSGRGGPSRIYKREQQWNLPEDEFMEMVREMGGTPEEMLEDSEIFAFFGDIIRADLRLLAEYKPDTTILMNIPIVGFYSEEDNKKEEMLLWQKETTAFLKLFKFKGNHFFIFEHTLEMAKIIKTYMQSSLIHSVSTKFQ